MNFASFRRVLVLPLFVVSLASAATVETYFLGLSGQKSGVIKGGVTQKGREGSIQVLDISHVLTSPRDAVSGMATGKRQHKPLTVTIGLDRSAPLLYNALVTNEVLTSFDLRVWTPGLLAGTGVPTEVQVYTIKLTNASISNIQEITEKDASGASRTRLAVSFTYQRIEWTWNDGGITAMDNWQ